MQQAEKAKYFLKNYLFKPIEEIKLTEKDEINIMMIDDNQKDIDLFDEILKTECSFKVQFHPYTNPIKTLAHLESKKGTPDLIILDLIMPIVNGKLVLKRLKNITLTKNIPIIIYSSTHNYENVMRVIELDAHAFFEKPLDGEMFEKFVMH